MGIALDGGLHIFSSLVHRSVDNGAVRGFWGLANPLSPALSFWLHFGGGDMIDRSGILVSIDLTR